MQYATNPAYPFNSFALIAHINTENNKNMNNNKKIQYNYLFIYVLTSRLKANYENKLNTCKEIKRKTYKQHTKQSNVYHLGNNHSISAITKTLLHLELIYICITLEYE
jgi:hypothetical protein